MVNKHLLPVWDQPMIYYPIQSMVKSGITDIMLVCGGNNPGDFLKVLGNGSEFGLKHIAYTYQKEAGGIAEALALAEHWSKGEPICVMLGDNILLEPFGDAVEDFKHDYSGARIFLTEVEHPEWYGVVYLNDDGKISRIVEKPKNPKSNLISIGLYFYDSGVWSRIKRLVKSKRGELEITDLNNLYLKGNAIFPHEYRTSELKHYKVKGIWADAGESIDTYLNTCIKVRDAKREQYNLG